jgi:hypothetical protein
VHQPLVALLDLVQVVEDHQEVLQPLVAHLDQVVALPLVAHLDQEVPQPLEVVQPQEVPQPLVALLDLAQAAEVPQVILLKKFSIQIKYFCMVFLR